MTTIDPEIYDRLTPLIESQGFIAHLDVEVRALSVGSCEITLAYEQRWSQQDGVFHSGIVGTLADNSASLAGASVMPVGQACAAAEYKMNLLTPAKGDRLIARAKVIKSGRTLVVAESNIYSQSGAEERHVATALLTFVAV